VYNYKYLIGIQYSCSNYTDSDLLCFNHQSIDCLCVLSCSIIYCENDSIVLCLAKFANDGLVDITPTSLVLDP
jgi:hypothetical protein